MVTKLRRKAKSGRDTAARIRALRAIDLRGKGYTFEAIAIELCYASGSGAFHAIERTLSRQEELAVHQHRALMTRQLDALLRTLYEQLEHCKTEEDRLWVIDRIRGILADKCKVLGLYPSANDPALATGYVKHIVLELADGPLQLGPGGTVDAEG
jgi:hypothetical protein